MKEKQSFIMYQSWSTMIRELPNEQAGDLIKAICRYQDDPEALPEDPVMIAVFLMIRDKLDQDAEKYAAICEMNRQNGAKGGRPRKEDRAKKKASGFKKKANGFRKNPEKPESDSDTDSDTESPDGDVVDARESAATTTSVVGAVVEDDPAVVESELPVVEEPERDHAAEGGVVFTLQNGQKYQPPVTRIRAWKNAFPELDIDVQLAQCAAKYHTLKPEDRRNRFTIDQYIVSWMQIADGDRKKIEKQAGSGSGGRKRAFSSAMERAPVPERELMVSLVGRNGNLV